MTDPAGTQADPIRTETVGADTMMAAVTVTAPRPVVFSAFTDPDVLAQWFWPQRFGTQFVSDLRPGGEFKIIAAGLPEGQDMGVSGVYQDVEAPARVTMSWQWNGETPVTHVSIELTEAAPDRTEVSVTHTANPTVTDRDDHVVGWRDCLTRLVQKYGTTSR
ncbi:MAG: SRPBCC domain-containing protein [Actinomycetota bacterium]|nr:SRPBCC domain-containing protein [Actinomycetota bacterium]